MLKLLMEIRKSWNQIVCKLTMKKLHNNWFSLNYLLNKFTV